MKRSDSVWWSLIFTPAFSKDQQHRAVQLDEGPVAPEGRLP